MVTEKFDRDVLVEGRNFGIGFAILNKISENNYETLTPFSCCKDYLNDVAYLQKGFSFIEEIDTKIHGFKHVLVSNKVLYKDSYFYLGIRILNDRYHSPVNIPTLEKLEEKLFSERGNLLYNLNLINRKRSSKDISIDFCDEETMVLKLPKVWIKDGPSISFITLMIRVLIGSSKLENLDSNNISKIKPIILGDVPLLRKIISYPSGILGVIKQLKTFKYKNKMNKYDVHGKGIISILD